MINRFIISELEQELSQPEIAVVLGPRQTGKSTVLREMERRLQEKGVSSAFFDLEQPRVLADFNRPDAEIVDMLLHSGQVVFIDEFQYLADASRLLKAVFDAKSGVKVFCSGSSAVEIHTHLKESLAGRRFLFRIFPLSYKEIQPAGINLDDYLIYGGMPGLLHTDDNVRKQRMLEELLSTYILKDVKSLVREENLRAFNHLMYILAEHQGSVISIHSLAAEVGLSSKALNRYLDILEATYVNFRVSSYSSNLGNELKKSTKTYLYDTGMRNSILRDFSSPHERPDKGILYESTVFLSLLSKRRPNEEIRFWRTKEGDEVDFILVRNRKPIPIEVKSGLREPAVPSGLCKFLKRYPVKEAFVVNESISMTVPHEKTQVHFVVFNDFLE